MEIACLGWGSLIWNPGGLPVVHPWRNDGPMLPVEFARQSSDNRITLVLVDGWEPVQTLWAKMQVPDLKAAQAELASREGIREQDLHRYIGFWTPASTSGGLGSAAVSIWAEKIGIEAVVWTALPARFHGKNLEVPSESDLLNYLRQLNGETRQRAEEYVRNAPRQISTRYRCAMERDLGWLPVART